MSKHDPIDHPSHYTSSPARCSACDHPIECIDITKHMGFCLGNVLKYCWRADLKGAALEDLKKARQYLDFEIAKRTPWTCADCGRECPAGSEWCPSCSPEKCGAV